VDAQLVEPSVAGTTPSESDRSIDFETVRRALAGSEDAFIDLVRKYESRIFTLVSRIVSNREDAEDVTQEAFTKAYARLSSFTFQSAFFTWLYRIAVNAAADFVKSRRRRRTTSLDALAEAAPAVAPPQSRPERSASRGELRERLRLAIADLPPVFRTVLVLRELEDLAYDEIAKILGCSIGTVESRLFRARARIREALGPYVAGGSETSTV
jgi:RNA polymerase sigma-70 factor (ECF subfamily)